MAEQEESSVLFSLKELMKLEEDRVRQEEESERKRVEARAAREREERQSGNPTTPRASEGTGVVG